MLSTGRASDITEPDDEGDLSTELSGPTGAGGEDQTQLQIRLTPPTDATCFAFDFRFFSEEYPEYVGSIYNDTFTAEIIDTDLTLSNDGIVTPYNFAYDTEGNAISINTVFGMTPDTETTFDGSTPLLSAITPVELSDDENMLITLTIQDLGDSIYDSAVAIDNARWFTDPDCEAGATVKEDADEDGLPDDWETDGLDVDGDGTIDLDLPAMGADPGHKDLFLEIDWMFEAQTCIWFICWGGEDFSPDEAALADVIQAFADAPVDNPDGTTGINLHIDAGPDSVMDTTTATTWGSLGRGNAVDHVEDLGANVNGTFSYVDCLGNTVNYNQAYSWEALDTIKDANFDDVRRDVFHYTLYADTYGGSSSSGISRGIPAADLIVSQGEFNSGDGFTLIQERGTLMHEFGHNLGLRHGGNDNCNREPNYLSIMSYSFQLVGLRDGPSDGLLDYSAFDLNDLDETSLDETVGLDPDADVGTLGTRWWCGNVGQVSDNAAGAIDWDCDGSADETSASVNINRDSFSSTLTGHDDWANLRFDGGAIGQLGVEESPAETRDVELTKEEAEELGVLAGMFDVLLDAPATALLLPGTDERSIFFSLTNVGTMTDSYDVQVTGIPVTSGPDDPTLIASETAVLAAVVDTDTIAPGLYYMEVAVISGGLSEVVAVATIEVTVPDLTDPAMLAAAQEALDDLEDLLPGTGPDPDTLDQLLDMLEEGVRPDPRVALQEARDTLADLEDSKDINNAIKAFDRALQDKRWVDDDELASSGGSSVFAQLQQAVRDVERADIDPEVADAVTMAIAGAAEDLLDRAYELAEEAGVSADVLAAVAPMIDVAEATAETGDPRAAMGMYQDAWDILNDAMS